MFVSSCKNRAGYKSYRVVAWLILSIAAALPAFAQSQTQPIARQTVAATPVNPEADTAGKLSFEVASVRPGRKFYLNGWDFLNPVNKAAPKGNLFSWNVQLRSLIYFAYDLRSIPLMRGVSDQLPQWAQDEWYAIEARADGDPSREDVQQMVRSLLEERFKFAAHTGTREGQVNALTVDKPGL